MFFSHTSKHSCKKIAVNKPCWSKCNSTQLWHLTLVFWSADFFLHGLENACSTSANQNISMTRIYSQKLNRQSTAKNSAGDEYDTNSLWNILLMKIDFSVSYFRAKISVILRGEIILFAFFRDEDMGLYGIQSENYFKSAFFCVLSSIVFACDIFSWYCLTLFSFGLVRPHDTNITRVF